jgi:hypothetical protein
MNSLFTSDLSRRRSKRSETLAFHRQFRSAGEELFTSQNLPGRQAVNKFQPAQPHYRVETIAACVLIREIGLILQKNPLKWKWVIPVAFVAEAKSCWNLGSGFWLRREQAL